MKLLVLSDIHGNRDAATAVSECCRDCDAVLVGGDVTDFGSYEEANVVIEILQQCCGRVYAVPGNCDPDDAERGLNMAGVNLNGKTADLDAFSLIGIGGVFSSSSAYEFMVIAEKAAKQATHPDSLILVTHQPAWHTKVDRSMLGRHSGNRAIRQFIETYQPVLAISGHIHEAEAVDTIGSTVLINPGPCRKGYFGIVTIGPDKQVDAVLERI